MHPFVHCSIVYNSQNVEATCVHQYMSGWRICGGYTHTHTHNTGILLKHKKEWYLAICDKIGGLEDIMLSEASLTKKTNTVWLHLYADFTYTHIDTREQTGSCWAGGSQRMSKRGKGD